jgi:hypothetical protein
MVRRVRRALAACVIQIGACLALAAGCRAAPRIPPAAVDPAATVFLTWQGDPTTTMTVHWLAPPGESPAQVRYWPAGGTPPRVVSGTSRPLPGGTLDLLEVRLSGLQPGAEYAVQVSQSPRPLRFRTMPADDRDPVTFVVGGDVFQGETLDERMYRMAAGCDPMFVVIGGDIVYDDGDPWAAERWHRWLTAWSGLMVASDGRSIPLLAAIGNHEVAGSFGKTPREAPWYYALFVPPGGLSHRVVDFGGFMSIVLLDSGHTTAVGGEQAAWLESVLAARTGVPHLFAVYHVPAYPSVRSFGGEVSPDIRRHWSTLFDRYGLDVAFEHHDHAYKRTVPVRGGREDPGGVVYLGDGGWGVAPRTVHDPDKTWYLRRAESVQSIIITTVHRGSRTHRAVGPGGDLIDAWGQSPVSADR